jgi:hypothetical protein
VRARLIRAGGGAVVIGFGAALRAAGACTPAFAVGVLRRDGIIVPFAAFNGKRWSSPCRRRP